MSNFKTNAKISTIRLFPIKSAKSIEVEKCQIVAGKIKYDRTFVLYNAEKNQCLNQKNERRLVRILPEIKDDTFWIKFLDEKGEKVIKEYNFKENIDSTFSRKKGKIIKVLFREKKIDVLDMGDEVAQFISECFTNEKGDNFRLLKQLEERDIAESINDDKTDENILLSYKVFDNKDKKAIVDGKTTKTLNFGNRTPVSLLSNETVDFINKNNKGLIVKEENYRSNLIVSGCAFPFEEESWKKFNIGKDLQFQFIRGSPRRCVMTGIDQDTGKLDMEINKLLKEKRSINKKIPDVCALVALVKEKSNGFISVGDKIEIVEQVIENKVN